MLEIQDEEWRNAVEGYLNTQRFYVLVEPENFDIALGIYDRLRKEKKVYGVGLINTRDLGNYDTAPAGTLASVVTSQNQYARQYSNMILGKVQMCELLRGPEKVPHFHYKGLYALPEPGGKRHQARGIPSAVYRQKCLYRSAGSGRGGVPEDE